MAQSRPAGDTEQLWGAQEEGDAQADEASCEVLQKGDVVLRLRDACVRTPARRAHSQLVSACLDGTEVIAHFEAPLELLRRFLMHTDFNLLRSQHQELSGGNDRRVRLYWQGEAVQWEIWRAP